LSKENLESNCYPSENRSKFFSHISSRFFNSAKTKPYFAGCDNSIFDKPNEINYDGVGSELAFSLLSTRILSQKQPKKTISIGQYLCKLLVLVGCNVNVNEPNLKPN